MEYEAPSSDAHKPRLVTVTPKLAQEWLEGPVHNRELKQVTVDFHIGILRSGDWKLTPDAVAFDTDGKMTNGQHRCSAIFLSGISAPMYVVRGLDPEAILATDQGRKRAVHEQISLTDGVEISKIHIAIARAMAGGLEGRMARTVPRTIHEMRRFVGRHYDAIITSDLLIHQNVKGVSSAGVKAVLARATYHVDANKLKNFARILETGTNMDGSLSPNENAPVVLRDMLIRHGSKARYATLAREVYARTERALAAYLIGRSLKHRVDPVQEELYPLPEETAAEEARIKATKRKIKVIKGGGLKS